MGTVFNPNDPKWRKEALEIIEKSSANNPIYRPSFVEDVMRITNEYYGGESYDVSMTIDDLLLKDRIVMIGKPIDDIVAYQTIQVLLYLQSEDATRDVSIYINSPGGSVTAGLAIYDTMQFLEADVSTFCVGMAMSMGAVLLAAGAPKKRYCLPNSTVLIHQPLVSGGIEGQASDIEIEAREIIRTRDRLYQILAHHTGQTLERIAADSDRDNYMTAQQAVDYGLVDEILVPSSKEDEEK
ncbi:ATP-dependent Clp protease protease subunit [Thermosporothrix hazakensis]|jgi:ATP-dependent Clp protease protease subunit|uniref:ATP-dependent Clp protease proteolytic subunit n=3 Tax=Thermosporothrix TaxID=768650 RepID=A0A326UE95_THEHA|nr:ATP-dependent Clp protease proteolytic subunit [Thermosporothrix hazakensis]PZW36616.1 ATP-dependent Clp protease protease subunit [Thermosporothrix hazakensis]BBH89084.1 ATP-dependent Clp protease proteolytic subunit [Thermosporothrix sp. COM3]GCE47267.1 ATP-dependent Clp protease proteolytic subunit [Thermosporothrix hazakensis]